MTVRFRPFRFDDEDYAVLTAIRRTEGHSGRKIGELREYDASTRAVGKQIWRVIAETDGQPVGCASYRELQNYAAVGRRLVWISVLETHRCGGIGRALWGELYRSAKVAGVDHFMVELRCPSAGYLLADDLGFRETERMVEQSINPQESGPQQLPDANGLCIMTLAELKAQPDWLERVYELFCDVSRRVPSPVKFVPPGLEQFERTDLTSPMADHDQYLIAVAPSGQWVGFTELRCTEAGVRTAMAQWLTGTRAGWTGQGVASLLKCKSVETARAAGVTSIWTTTSVTNAAMIGANRRAGYRDTGTWVFMEKTEDVGQTE